MVLDIDSLIAVICCIVANIIIFTCVKYYSRKIKDNSYDVMTDSYEDVGRREIEFTQIWNVIKFINIIVGIIGLVIYFVFFAFKAQDTEPVVIGTKTTQEVRQIVPQTVDQIEQFAKKREVERFNNVDKDLLDLTSKSRKSFEDRLNSK